MKGIVFTSFLDLVEEKFGYEIIDRILLSCDLPSGGVYTSIGTYEHSEMIYHSKRKMADFAEGLIRAVFDQFGEQGQIERENIEIDGSVVRFIIRKV